MKTKDIIELLKQGKQPFVKLTGQLWDDGWGETGMIARITSYREANEAVGNLIEIKFDYNTHKAQNLALQSHSYFTTNGNTGTIFEAGLMKEDDIQEESFFAIDDEVPVEVVDSALLLEYIEEKSAIPYVQWLEEEVTLLRERYLKIV